MEEEEGYHDKHQLESSEQKKRHGKERQQTKPIHLSIAHTGEVEEEGYHEGYDEKYQLEDSERIKRQMESNTNKPYPSTHHLHTQGRWRRRAMMTNTS